MGRRRRVHLQFPAGYGFRNRVSAIQARRGSFHHDRPRRPQTGPARDCDAAIGGKIRDKGLGCRRAGNHHLARRQDQAGSASVAAIDPKSSGHAAVTVHASEQLGAHMKYILLIIFLVTPPAAIKPQDKGTVRDHRVWALQSTTTMELSSKEWGNDIAENIDNSMRVTKTIST